MRKKRTLRDQNGRTENKRAKKDHAKSNERKGQAPAFIAAVENSDSDVDVHDMETEVDQPEMAFLAALDRKGIEKSRVQLKKEYRADKPAPLPRKSLVKIEKAPDEPKASELKALKNAEKKARRKGQTFDQDAFWREQREKAQDGELVDDLDEDDLAFGSGSENDDDLSVMSDWSGQDSLSSFDDDSAASNLDSSEDDEPARSLQESDKEELGSGLSSEDDDGELDPLPPEETYSRRPFRQVASNTTSLPVIANGLLVPGRELSRSPSLESPSSRSPTPAQQQEYRADPFGKRFGRPAIRSILEMKDRRLRATKAKEEIANLGNEASAIGEGEGSLNLVRRLLALSGRKFKSDGSKPLRVDTEIRAMAMISLVAVFADVLPDYRIRPLTDAEKQVKVSQAVMRQREWEEGIVDSYKRFLGICEAEVSHNTDLSLPAIHALCTLVQKKSDFNFAVNVLDVIVKRLGRKGWDHGHELCLESIAWILVNDTTTASTNSLHVVRLISRLVRARSFGVRPEVVSVLLNLRLKDELSSRIRASTNSAQRDSEAADGKSRYHAKRGYNSKRGGKAKAAMKKAGSKKARQAAKERQAIEKEMKEAEGEVDNAERERNMTETLKLLFALYFRILKLEYRSPLLPAALEGVARFAHLVNIDFFRDLLEVLKSIVSRDLATLSDLPVSADEDLDDARPRQNGNREALLCIVTAFELLQGQGQALTVDLGDFVTALYTVLPSLALSSTLEEVPRLGKTNLARANTATGKLAQTEADLLFRALSATFLSARSLPPPTRTLAFAKRLLTSCLNWPPATQKRTLGFLKSLLIREPRLEAMLETGDHKVDGRWNGHIHDPERAQPESTCWWEGALMRQHVDEEVRVEARHLMNWVRQD